MNRRAHRVKKPATLKNIESAAALGQICQMMVRRVFHSACGLAMAALAWTVLVTPPAQAQGLKLSRGGSESGARIDSVRRAARVIDGRLSEQYSASTRYLPNAEKDAVKDAPAIPRYAGSYRGAYLEQARAAARAHNVPEDLFLRLVHQESRWNAQAVSHKGAIGLAQLMPDTARDLNVDPTDPEQNLNGGARYLRMMYDRFGDWRLALAAYNAGPGAVAEHGGVPPFAETQNYVRVILGAG
jgi:soluble lytic murein transglycosylase-like protein